MRFKFTCIALLGTCALASADIFHMKDGTKVEGELISRDANEYKIMVHHGETIKYEQTFPRDQVVRQERLATDGPAFEKIKDLAPAPDMLPVEEYDERIAELNKFLDEHDLSSHRRTVRGMIRTLEDEKKQIEAGSTKINGKLITQTEYQKKAYELDAGVAKGRVDAALKKQDYNGAIQAWENMKSDFAGCDAYSQASASLKNALTRHKSRLTTMINEVDAKKDERKRTVGSMTGNSKANAIKVVQDSNKAVESTYKREKSQGVKILTVSEYHKTPSQDTINNINQIIRSMNNHARHNSAELYNTIWQAIDAQDFAKAKEVFEEIKIDPNFSEKYKTAVQAHYKQAWDASKK